MIYEKQDWEKAIYDTGYVAQILFWSMFGSEYFSELLFEKYTF